MTVAFRPLRRLAEAAAFVALGSSLALAQRAPQRAPAAGAGTGVVRLRDVSSRLEVRFTHSHGGCGRRDFAEQVGGGALPFDYDNDGWLDLLLLSGRPLGDCPATGSRTRLLRNLGGRRFADVTDEAALEDPGYATGGATGDIDGDGDEDVFVACLGPDRLYRNDDGRFVEVGARAGVAHESFSTSASFFDYDGDGDLDLYVASYVELPRAEPRCGRQGKPVYCAPQRFRAAPDRLYRNRGEGTFEDVTREARVFHPRGRALALAVGDYNTDGRPDVYVANDASDNVLWENQGDGTFRDVALRAGVALGEDGAMENGMGADWGDFDGDGLLDLVVSNFAGQTHTLYRNLGDGYFLDVSYPSGTGAASFPLLGWGAVWTDLDLDGRLDLYIANGHVFDNIADFGEGGSFAQPDLLFHNRGDGSFRSLPVAEYRVPPAQEVGRAVAAGDLDNDGDPDLVLNPWNSDAVVLRNDTERDSRRHWIGLALRGVRSNHSAIGAQVRFDGAGGLLLREVKGASGYLSQGDRRVVLPLAAAPSAGAAVRFEVRWPAGGTERFELRGAVDRYVTVREGSGVPAHSAPPPPPRRP